MPLLDQLNDRQREAVQHTEGPLLVLAGAGTGKTRVITYRAAYLVEKGAAPQSILCVTFTNKAAEQMKNRIADLLRSTGHDASDMWISTFHSFSARLLRREAPRLGLPRDFAIYDDDAQTAAVKLALQQLQLSDRDFPPRSVRERISYAKNHGLSSADLAEQRYEIGVRDISEIFDAYQSILNRAGALDFDDLLLLAVDVLEDHPEARRIWSERFRYIQVDEYQDTNAAQEQLIRLLAGPQRNVAIVGDEDQSIYSWRGARAGNMQRFLDHFSGTHIVRLEENYRSTQTILDAAAGVVANNRSRLGKTLRATKGPGSSIRFFEGHDAGSEAEFISGEIAAAIRSDPNAKVAVLYRTTSQSRALEECLRRVAIRYRVVGGFSFYQRAEVRDALAYVRLVFHPEDDVALLRVLNTPPRGIGDKTVELLRNAARERSTSLWDAIPEVARPGIARGGAALQGFRVIIESLRAEIEGLTAPQLLRRILDASGYLGWIEQQDNLDHTSRAENLSELLNALAEATEAGQTLQDMLDQAALVSSADDFEEDVAVTLMTLHSAKGLEFDTVYLSGLEEGLLPHSRSKEDENVEEERRLFYVGMTRAKRSLTLTRALYRRSWGEERLRTSMPSRFLAEVPGELIESAQGSLAEPGETRRYEPDPDFFANRSRGQSRGFSRPRIGSARYSAPRPGTHPLVGTRVRHQKFGLGTILSVEEEEDDRMLTISFSDYGTKKLKERYANLQLA